MLKPDDKLSTLVTGVETYPKVAAGRSHTYSLWRTGGWP
jgi:hypothetical protein